MNKGIGCASCHGRVDEMPLMYEENSLQMEWCLNCHRNPAGNLRPTRRFTTWRGQAPRRQASVVYEHWQAGTDVGDVSCTTTDPGTGQNPELAQAEGAKPLGMGKPQSGVRCSRIRRVNRVRCRMCR